jgi:uncharacterized coiled-coil protein SlyX
VAENQATIEQLREERSLLASSHRDLQRRYAEASEVRHDAFQDPSVYLLNDNLTECQ